MGTKAKKRKKKESKESPGTGVMVPTSEPGRQKAWGLSPLWGSMDVATGHLVDNDNHPGTIGLPFETLRLMSRVPLISAIIHTRVNQASEFCVPQETDHSLGYKIKLREGSGKASKASEKQAAELSKWLRTCGDPRVNPGMNFERMTRMALHDSWSFDQLAIEKIPTWGGKPAAIAPVDASTIRRAAWTDAEKAQGRRNADSGYVQIIDNQLVAEFDTDELIFGVRRPRTWIKVNGYGYPELEELAGTVVRLLNAEMYNANNFRHGMNVSGILAVTSAMDPALFRAFQREFHANLSGAAQSRKTPLIQLDPDLKEKIDAVDLGVKSNRDMEFSEWISWLLRLACMTYQMDPSELGYQYGNEGQSHVWGERSPAERIAISRERGLRPTIRMYEEWLNGEVIYLLHEDFELRFYGFDAEDEDTKLERDLKRVEKIMTRNEIREERGHKRMEGAVWDMPADPSFINAQQAYDMQQQDQDGQDQDGQDQDGQDQDGQDQDPPDDFDVDKLFGGSQAFGGEDDLNKAFPVLSGPRVVRVEVL